MAVFEHAHYGAAVRPSVFTRIADNAVQAFHSLHVGFQRYVARTRTEAQLHALSNRQLEDIGLERADIARVSRSMTDRIFI